MVETWQLRAAFARRLSQLYGQEVPAYLTLVEETQAVNAEVLARFDGEPDRLGGASRISAERHGAIRVGSDRELAQVGRLFAALGMHPVGFYDLRDSGVPVVSTAFRPLDADELELNPFRVFTSVLTPDDTRFFGPDLGARVRRRVDSRELFPPELLDLADRCTAEAGLPQSSADRFLQLLGDAFQLDAAPIDKAWYDELHAVSAVAADIAGCPSTHINHLTPRVLDIDALHARMTSRGIAMIPEIQGPPAWDGPDLLLRQTSFKALAEDRRFLHADGAVARGQLRVRFGEVEARGIAPTAQGLARYEAAMRNAHEAATDQDTWPDALREAWERAFPRTEQELFLAGLGTFTAAVVAHRPQDGRGPDSSLAGLVRNGFVTLHPVVYEDFLPRSAAGIFRSNLDHEGLLSESLDATPYGRTWLEDALQRDVHDPDQLYAHVTEASLQEVADQLDLPHELLDTRSPACL